MQLSKISAYSFSFCLLIHLIHSYNTPALTLILRTVLLVFPQTYSCFYIRTTPFPKEALRRPLRFLLRETSRSQAAPIVQVHPILLTPPVRPNNAKEAEEIKPSMTIGIRKIAPPRNTPVRPAMSKPPTFEIISMGSPRSGA